MLNIDSISFFNEQHLNQTEYIKNLLKMSKKSFNKLINQLDMNWSIFNR